MTKNRHNGGDVARSFCLFNGLCECVFIFSFPLSGHCSIVVGLISHTPVHFESTTEKPQNRKCEIELSALALPGNYTDPGCLLDIAIAVRVPLFYSPGCSLFGIIKPPWFCASLLTGPCFFACAIVFSEFSPGKKQNPNPHSKCAVTSFTDFVWGAAHNWSPLYTWASACLPRTAGWSKKSFLDISQTPAAGR